MRFHLTTSIFSKQTPLLLRISNRTFSPPPYNHQCRAYTGLQRQLTKRSEHLKTPSQFFSYFAVSRKFYSSESGTSKMGFLKWYLRMLERRPVLTKSISSAVIYGLADITSQVITMEQYDTWDQIRTLRMAAFGLIILGPAQHMWFNFLGRLLPKRDVISTLKKLAMGQVAFGPLINGTFFSFNAALQGESGYEITARLRRDLIPTLLNGLMYWPICDFLTYKVIPVHLQPLMNSSFSFLWSIYLTYMASLKKVGAD